MMVGRDVTYKFIEIKSPSPLQGDVLLSHYVDCDVRGIMLALSGDAITLGELQQRTVKRPPPYVRGALGGASAPTAPPTAPPT